MEPILSVVVPMYNEEEVIMTTHGRLFAVLEGMGCSFEVVYVNDGSRDGTLDLMQPLAKADPRVRLVNFARNFGHQCAVSCGLGFARGQAIVIIDADLQDPPELIPQMLKHWREGWDVVYGKRAERKGETAFKKLTASVFYKLMNYLSDGIVPKDTGDFRLIDKKVRDTILAMPEHNLFLRGMVAWVGFRQMPLEYVREARFAGVTKYPLKKMIQLAANGMFAFSFKPLKLFTAVGLFMNFLAAIWLILALCFRGFYANWLGCLVLACTGILLAALGIMGEYIGRTYEEAKGRPNYIVRTTPDEYFDGEADRSGM